MDWNSGYVTDVEYTHGYYREISPCLIDFVMLLNGYEPPRRTSMCYLELGYGQGLSANIHAAAIPGRFFGTDFNPDHAANAQALAQVSQASAQFFDDSFIDLAARDDLPEFDYIAIHGIWSWVTDANRNAIIEIIRKRLKVGGAVYISYNTLPGWASAMPLRHILALHAEMVGSDAQGIVDRIGAAIKFGKHLGEIKARYFLANPSVGGRLEKIAEQDSNYLAHEYFNHEWQPMYFSEIYNRLGSAKLNFACSAVAIDGIDHINFSQDQRKTLGSISNTVLKESVRDIVLNTQFRRDIFARGARRLKAIDRLERIKEVRVALLNSADDFDFSVTGGLGKMGLKKEIYAPLLDALRADDFTPKKIGDLAKGLDSQQISLGVLIEAIAILVGTGRVSPVQSEENIELAKPQCHRLNRHLIERARLEGNLNYLASPVIGGGIHVGRFEQMFLQSRSQGLKEPNQWAQDAWRHLATQRQSVVKNGKALTTDEENLAELNVRALAFAETRLPLLKVALIAE